MTYEDVLRQLEEKAREKNCERWLIEALNQIEGQPGPGA